jgi:hypothetical protein
MTLPIAMQVHLKQSQLTYSGRNLPSQLDLDYSCFCCLSQDLSDLLFHSIALRDQLLIWSDLQNAPSLSKILSNSLILHFTNPFDSPISATSGCLYLTFPPIAWLMLQQRSNSDTLEQILPPRQASNSAAYCTLCLTSPCICLQATVSSANLVLKSLDEPPLLHNSQQVLQNTLEGTSRPFYKWLSLKMSHVAILIYQLCQNFYCHNKELLTSLHDWNNRIMHPTHHWTLLSSIRCCQLWSLRSFFGMPAPLNNFPAMIRSLMIVHRLQSWDCVLHSGFRLSYQLPPILLSFIHPLCYETLHTSTSDTRFYLIV